MDFTRDASYFESLDKRTKEYREYKAFIDAQPKGLGDTIEKITERTGIKKTVEKVAEALGFEDCGCEQRKERLNAAFRYLRPECLTEDEFVYLSEWFSKPRAVVTGKEQRKLLDIYNRVFKTNREPSNCSSCVKEVQVRLERLMNVHKQ